MPVKTDPNEAPSIYQLKIGIRDIEPPVWRRVCVAEDSSLDDLHLIIQHIFDWDNSHLHEFHTPRGDFASTMLDDFMEENPDIQASEDVMLSEIFTKGTRKIEYWYDFGDDWMHDITLEKRLKPEPGVKYPVVIDGAGAAPPEDCGGPMGYMNLMDIAKKGPKDEWEKELVGWLGKSFDPARFNLAACNRVLHRNFKPRVLVRAPRPKKPPASK